MPLLFYCWEDRSEICQVCHEHSSHKGHKFELKANGVERLEPLVEKVSGWKLGRPEETES